MGKTSKTTGSYNFHNAVLQCSCFYHSCIIIAHVQFVEQDFCYKSESLSPSQGDPSSRLFSHTGQSSLQSLRRHYTTVFPVWVVILMVGNIIVLCKIAEVTLIGCSLDTDSIQYFGPHQPISISRVHPFPVATITEYLVKCYLRFLPHQRRLTWHKCICLVMQSIWLAYEQEHVVLHTWMLLALLADMQPMNSYSCLHNPTHQRSRMIKLYLCAVVPDCFTRVTKATSKWNHWRMVT